MKNINGKWMVDEPVCFAYRVDGKEEKTFGSWESAGIFFRMKPQGVLHRANGKDGNHVVGRHINERWIVINCDRFTNKEVSEIRLTNYCSDPRFYTKTTKFQRNKYRNV